jgi:hypothetical protein
MPYHSTILIDEDTRDTAQPSSVGRANFGILIAFIPPQCLNSRSSTILNASSSVDEIKTLYVLWSS